MYKAIKNFYHKLGSYPWFYKISGKIIPVVGILSIVIIFVSSAWGLFFSPADAVQGEVYRIIYFHVPAVSVSQMIYYSMSVAAAVFLIWRMKMAGVFIKSLAPIGASFTFLGLLSGAIWGQPTWGTWWVWDARLTSYLVLFLFYLAIIGMQSTFTSRKSADTAISIITLVGLVNLPIVKKSVEWWNTLHQPASISITGESSISNEILIPLLLSISGIYLFVFFIGLLFMRAEISSREQNKAWFKNSLNNK
tara:strand:+ start:218 stop:967 length:750 start_codon:yes stop_codon:yes gene_type:complete